MGGGLPKVDFQECPGTGRNGPFYVKSYRGAGAGIKAKVGVKAMGFHGGAGHLFCLRPVLPPAAAIGYEPTRRGLYKAPFYIMADMGRLGGRVPSGFRTVACMAGMGRLFERACAKQVPYGWLHGGYGPSLGGSY